MSMKNYLFFLLITVFSGISCAQEDTEIKSPKNINYSYEIVVPDVDIPWGLSFISENEFLYTEKSGQIFKYNKGEISEIKGLPDIYVRGQGGLLDIAIHPNYKENKVIFFTASSPLGEEKGGNTALWKAQLKNNNLENLKLLYKGEENSTKGQHFGSRIIFDKMNNVYFTIGDRGNRDKNPQDLNRDGGKVYRLTENGEIPETNPFFDKNISKKAIYSYGHRNPQGMTRNPTTGDIWIHEHGPKGGDEINIVKPGKNYGWPKITYGVNYSGTIITDQTEAPDMEQPIHYWIPSIAPSGMSFSTSDVYPNWKNNLFVGSLIFEYLERIVLDGSKVVERIKVLDKIGRVRNVVESPNGFLYIELMEKELLKFYLINYK